MKIRATRETPLGPVLEGATPTKSRGTEQGTETAGPKPFYIRVSQYSPLAFNGKDVENDFFYVHLATQCAATYKSMKLLGFYIAFVCCRLATATTREGLYTLGWGLAVSGLCLFWVILSNSNPQTFAKYSQGLAVLLRLLVPCFNLACQRIAPGHPIVFPSGIGSYGCEGQLFLLLMTSLGARLPFIPNLAASLSVLLVLLSRNADWCARMADTPALDMRALSRVTELGTDVTRVMLLLPPREATSTSQGSYSCEINVAFLQVGVLVISTSILFCMELLERRRFLKLRAEMLGAEGDEAAAGWPLGHPQGINTLAQAVATLLWIFCLTWQTILLWLESGPK